MAEGKYAKYVAKSPIVEGRFTNRLVYFSRKYGFEKNLSLIWNCITEPFQMVADAHSHDFDQFLHFYGGNSLDITQFDAVIELCLGDECEPQIITEPTVVHVPAGMMHCPLTYKEVRKPVIFMNVALAPEYIMSHKPAP